MAVCRSIHLRMDRCRVGFELTEQWLFRTQQPTLTTGFSGGGLVVRSLFGKELSLASTLAKLKRCQQTPMSIPWGDHLELARCVAMIGEDDLREATTAMADACPTCSGICCSRPGVCARRSNQHLSHAHKSAHSDREISCNDWKNRTLCQQF